MGELMGQGASPADKAKQIRMYYPLILSAQASRIQRSLHTFAPRHPTEPHNFHTDAQKQSPHLTEHP